MSEETLLENKRTLAQNRALHKWFRQLSDVLQERGLDMREIMKVPVKPTERVVKEAIWKPIMFKMYGKNSTTELLKRKEIDEIVDVIVVMFSDMKSDIIVPPFPSQEELSFKEEYSSKPVKALAEKRETIG